MVYLLQKYYFFHDVERAAKYEIKAKFFVFLIELDEQRTLFHRNCKTNISRFIVQNGVYGSYFIPSGINVVYTKNLITLVF